MNTPLTLYYALGVCSLIVEGKRICETHTIRSEGKKNGEKIVICNVEEEDLTNTYYMSIGVVFIASCFLLISVCLACAFVVIGFSKKEIVANTVQPRRNRKKSPARRPLLIRIVVPSKSNPGSEPEASKAGHSELQEETKSLPVATKPFSFSHKEEEANSHPAKHVKTMEDFNFKLVNDDDDDDTIVNIFTREDSLSDGSSGGTPVAETTSALL